MDVNLIVDWLRFCQLPLAGRDHPKTVQIINPGMNFKVRSTQISEMNFKSCIYRLTLLVKDVKSGADILCKYKSFHAKDLISFHLDAVFKKRRKQTAFRPR